MSSEIKQLQDDWAGQLSDLDDNVGASVDDVRLLADIRQNIGRLLKAEGSSEQEIRELLEQKYRAGGLRPETYQLVKSMLDRYTSEVLPTEHDADAQGVDNDTFASTAVLPDDAFEPATADDQVQVGSVLRDRFLLQERVSGGSMGVVYKALDRRLAEVGAESRWVAIKVLSPQLARSGSALRALQQEAAKGRCLSHPNVVRFIDFDRDEQLFFIVMEWLEGRTLAEILDSPDGKRITLDEALSIVRQVGRALDYAHRCGIVHADVKPGNIMICDDGTAKLFDFGIARVRQKQVLERRDFDPGVLGALTPAYSSMQVLTGEDPVPSDDVFSLGCLFYRLAAGYRVFGPRNAAEAAEEGMVPQRISSLSDSQWAALKRAIAFARVTRFQSVREFLDALAGDERGAVRAEPSQRFEDSESSGSRFALLGLVGLVVVLAVAAYQFGLSDRLGELIGPPDEAGAVVDAGQQVDDTPAPPADGADLPAGEAAAGPDAAAPAETGSVPAEATGSGQSGIDAAEPPPADVEVVLAQGGQAPETLSIPLREDGEEVIVELVRTRLVGEPLQLRIEEVSYSGKRSPWATGQYSLSAGNLVEIPAGRDRVRFTLSTTSDGFREADQLSTLRVRQAETTSSVLATIEVVIEDDDQRAFEAGMPPNTVGFTTDEIIVSERDPVVQIDVVRLNPDNQSVVIGYSTEGISAVVGEDYFEPSGYSLSFGPGQRVGRLLVPLVQDALVEGEESFFVELATRDQPTPAGVYNRVTVTIRDDEPLPAGGR